MPSSIRCLRTHRLLEEVAGLPETVSLRYNPGGVFSLGTDIMDHPEESKFGMTKAQLIQGYKDLKAKGVKNMASMLFWPPIPSPMTITRPWSPSSLNWLWNSKETTGVELDFIDLSGGHWSGLHPWKPAKWYCHHWCRSPCPIWCDFGAKWSGQCEDLYRIRYFMLAPHGHLVTKVLHIKDTIYHAYVGVDASATNLMRDWPSTGLSPHHQYFQSGWSLGSGGRDGDLCENNDKFAKHRELPRSAWGYLIIHDAGAHGFSMG